MPSTGLAGRGKNHNATPADLEAQIARLRDDLVDLTRTVTDLGTDQVEKTSSGVAKTSTDALDSVRHEVARLEKDLKSGVRDNPIQAIGIAAGIGFVAALLSRH